MARRQHSQRHARPDRVGARPRHRLTGLGALACLPAFGLAPLITAPPAQADVFDEVIDQILAPFMDAGTTTLDPSALLEQFVYAPIHSGIEQWIGSDIGQQVDGAINALAGSYVIGDGTAGTAAHPDGGAAGLLFGDGGIGWNSTEAGTGGGSGGAAGMFGDGGEGGSGGVDAAGGNGGSGGWLFGVGGHGGNGGVDADGGNGGDGPGWLLGNGGDGGDGNGVIGGDGLPALGGAGGNGGPFGDHGAVGHFGGNTTPTGDSDLTAAGGWLTNSDGQVVIQHGVNVVDKTPPFVPDNLTDAYVAQLEAAGVNTVRLGVQWAGVEPQPNVYDNDYLDSLEQTVQILQDHHIQVILDMHQDLYGGTGGDGAPDWATDTGGLPYPDLGFPYDYITPAVSHAFDTFWANDSVSGVNLENNYAQMWEHVADHFKDNPDVVGYEIMNEPWPGSQWLATVFGSSHFDEQQLTPFYNQVDSAIRAVDPNTPVYFEPNVLFGNLPVNTQLGTVDDPNSVFAFHPYCLTNQLFGGDFGCAFYEDLIDGWAADYADAHHIPAVITEFGNTNDATVLDTEMAAANKYGIGWLFWPIGLNATAANLDTLGQPYPELVSGTPGAWSFENDTFQFSYSTDRADGDGSFGAGSITDISVPVSQFPNGYEATVTGGQVVSAANATDLQIAADPGAGTVTVTVSPAS